MVVTTTLDVYVLPLPFETPSIWLCNQPLLSSFQANNIGSLQLQLIYAILDAHHMVHYEFPSALYFSAHQTLEHIFSFCT